LAERFATVDVGTNSVLLLVAERGGGGFVSVDEALEITRLGKGVDRTRRLAPEAIEATVAAVARFAARARGLGVADLVVTATSAARDATNGAEFFARAREAAGVEIEVLPGDVEAELSFEASWRDFGAPGVTLAVLDVGGGSTEVVLGTATQRRDATSASTLTFRHSFDVGAVRLTERHLPSDPPTSSELTALRADLARELAPVPRAPPGARLVGVAGTVTTLAAIELGLDGWDGRLVHGRAMRTTSLRALADRLAAMPLAERLRVKGLPEKRADTIVAGAEIVLAAAERLGVDHVVASDKGVRWGLLYRRFGG
jgi:exopolyphosphatase/guanosine-5'-triphosphate,3'-diphosphate pyrophosphatase